MKRLLICIIFLMLILGTCGCMALHQLGQAYKEAQNTATHTSSPASTPAHTPEPAESYGAGTPDESLAGVIDGDQYTNDALGFSVTIPKGWVFATDEKISELYGQVLEDFSEFAEIPENMSVILMLCSERQLGNETDIPNISLALLNRYIPKTMFEPLLKQYQDYSDLICTQNGAESVVITGEPSCAINNQEYIHFSFVYNYSTCSMFQDQYYIPVFHDMFIISQTYFTAEQKDIMDAFMHNIEYTNET